MIAIVVGILPLSELKPVWPFSTDPCDQRGVFAHKQDTQWMFSPYHLYLHPKIYCALKILLHWNTSNCTKVKFTEIWDFSPILMLDVNIMWNSLLESFWLYWCFWWSECILILCVLELELTDSGTVLPNPLTVLLSVSLHLIPLPADSGDPAVCRPDFHGLWRNFWSLR